MSIARETPTKPPEGEFRCCIPGCDVTGPKSGTNPPLSQLGDGAEAHVLCCPHLADWWLAQGETLKRPPNRSEWAAFLALMKREAA